MLTFEWRGTAYRRPSFIAFDMRKSLKRTLIATICLCIAATMFMAVVGIPLDKYSPKRRDANRLRHSARMLRDELLAFNSAEEIRDNYCCGTIVQSTEARWTYVRDTNTFEVGSRPALLFEFENGDWVALLYGNSHGNDPARDAVVTRDSNGEVRAYSGHVCGKPLIYGNSIEEIYARLGNSRLNEMSIDE